MNPNHRWGPSQKQFCVYQVFGHDRRTVLLEAWEQSEMLSRINGPALREFTANGAHLFCEWWRDGLLHRATGPAVVDFDEKGKERPVREEWWLNGKRHRQDGPARIWYDPETGEITDEEWWQNGARITPPQAHGRGDTPK